MIFVHWDLSSMSEFVGFTQHIISVSDSVSIYALKSGTGPPIVALHGHRENHLIWSDVAPGLVEHGFTVILLDLRGCGQSSKPHGDPEHETYSKRTMANDVIVLMLVFTRHLCLSLNWSDKESQESLWLQQVQCVGARQRRTSGS